jgi:hypothetical protein
MPTATAINTLVPTDTPTPISTATPTNTAVPPPTNTPTATATPTIPPPPPCTVTIATFSVDPLSPQSGVSVSWTTRTSGDCSKVVGLLRETEITASAGKTDEYHRHPVGFSGTRHIDPWPPGLSCPTFTVDFLLEFQTSDGKPVASQTRNVPFRCG